MTNVWRYIRADMKLLRLVLTLLLATPAAARDVQVAVAANFAEPAREIADGFARATGDRAVLAVGASGAFATQIAHGAPFEVFLSADADRPSALEKAGQAVRGSRFTYAIGRLVLWSRDPALVDGGGHVLARGTFAKLAIADPATAPYGAAAVETIAKLGLTARLAPKLVRGVSIAQAYQFAATGAADLGFVALAQVVTVKGGSRWLVPASLHAPIVQQAVLLASGAADPAARAFLRYLRGPEARAIVRRYGYEVR